MSAYEYDATVLHINQLYRGKTVVRAAGVDMARNSRDLGLLRRSQRPHELAIYALDSFGKEASQQGARVVMAMRA
jgi:hypothetical protein